jgi:hypothetical protein
MYFDVFSWVLNKKTIRRDEWFAIKFEYKIYANKSKTNEGNKPSAIFNTIAITATA